MILAILVAAICLLALVYIVVVDGYAPGYFNDPSSPPVRILEAESQDPLISAWQARINRTTPADWAAVGRDFQTVGDDMRHAMRELEQSPEFIAASLKGRASKGWNKTDCHVVERRAAVHRLQPGRGK